MADNSTHGKLEGVLSQRQLFAIGFGAIVGWGWIIQMGYWVDTAGPWGGITAFLVGGFLVALISLIYAELVSAMPKVGGEHVYSMRAFGPFGSFACSWSLLLGYLGVIAFQSIAFGVAISHLIPGLDTLQLWSFAGAPVYAPLVGIGLLGVLGITYMNYRGVRLTAQIQMALAAIICVAGLLMVVGAFTKGQPVANEPFGGVGLAGITVVAVQVPMLFVGFDVVPQAAEEADISPHSLAITLLAVVSCVALFYVITIWAAGEALLAEVLGASPVPAAAAMSALMGSEMAGQLMTVAGIGALLTSWSAFVIGASRVLFAMAETGMLPESLAKLHPDYNTPSNAILLTGAISAAAPWFGAQLINTVINAGSLGIVIAWFIVVLSFLRLRRQEPEMERPFKIPYGKTFGVISLVVTAFFILLYAPGGPSALGLKEWTIIGAWVLLGTVLRSLSGENIEIAAVQQSKSDD